MEEQSKQTKVATIYYLKCPIDGRIKYVGKTGTSLRERFRHHIHEARDGKVRTPKSEWINTLIESGTIPDIIQAEVVPIHDWENAERRHIQKLRDLNEPLFNVAAGGIGGGFVKGRKKSEGALLRMREGFTKTKKPIIQMDKDGNFIAEHSGVKEAGRTLDIQPTKISAVCRRKYGRNTTGGFKFKYKYEQSN